MTDLIRLVLTGVAGALLGAIFYGGLWWTIRIALPRRQPALWFIGSQMLRTLFCLSGFYVLGNGQWQRLAACLLGFVLAKLAAQRLLRAPTGRISGHCPGVTHAP